MYRLTEQGLAALCAYAATPARLTPLKSEPLLRLLIADLVGERLTREGLAALREDVDDLLGRLNEAEASTETLPHRRTYLLLVTGFLRRLRELGEGEGPTFADLEPTADATSR